MRDRILILVGLALAAAVSLMLCVHWARVLSRTVADTGRDRAEYQAFVWAGAFILFAAAWIYLFVKTLRYRSEQNQ